MVEAITILSHPFFTNLVLPFLLVFTLIFAILEKTKILGDNKQVNAIISFVTGLIFVSFAFAVNLTIQLMGVMVVLAIIILAFMILFGFISGEEFKMPKGLKILFGIIIGIVLITAIIILTGYKDIVFGAFTEGNQIVLDLVFIGIIIAAIFAVAGKKKNS